MFLTKMPINIRRRGAQVLLGSPQAMHAAVMAGFADPRPTEDARVLWRVDNYEGHRVVLYTVSPGKPDFSHIVEQAGWPTTESWQTRPYGLVLDRLRVGQRWLFRLTANPVHASRLDGWARTKPLGHVTVKRQEQWLIDRTLRAGFRLVSPDPDGGTEYNLAVVDRTVRRFRRKDGVVTIAVATFEGQLEVTDASAFRRVLSRGIGRAKSYGCGLLTVAPPTTARS
ncbi:Type I-E CRISPR-associated protein Cas6/Cse3/CasE [Mycobacterium canetti]|uniref:type I-E CRISPR-associated protein Cas6/Cse3/CasE n=1 Tax=Mycobacterium canetti TaxID=78331 RepID=UPI002D7756BA|nr:type I-E CRISPR-associated protein Cas6/Cse3/CasE [Mycobacterium canetti]WRO42897.1 Type I-E CRISPR-associated protein Cas6/Cse3/CasE [Mycobacterium canetti]